MCKILNINSPWGLSKISTFKAQINRSLTFQTFTSTFLLPKLLAVKPLLTYVKKYYCMLTLCYIWYDLRKMGASH